MKRIYEQLTLAVLAGLVLLGAAAFVITPAHALTDPATGTAPLMLTIGN